MPSISIDNIVYFAPTNATTSTPIALTNTLRANKVTIPEVRQGTTVIIPQYFALEFIYDNDNREEKDTIKYVLVTDRDADFVLLQGIYPIGKAASGNILPYGVGTDGAPNYSVSTAPLFTLVGGLPVDGQIVEFQANTDNLINAGATVNSVNAKIVDNTNTGIAAGTLKGGSNYLISWNSSFGDKWELLGLAKPQTPQVNADYTSTGGASQIQNLSVEQTGSANVPGTVTATSPEVNRLIVSDGTNPIVSLHADGAGNNFSNLAYNEVNIIPRLDFVYSGINSFPTTHQIKTTNNVFTPNIRIGDTVSISGNTSNNGTYTIANVTDDGAKTTITTVEAMLGVNTDVNGQVNVNYYEVVTVTGSVGTEHILLTNNAPSVILYGALGDFLKVRWDAATNQYIQSGGKVNIPAQIQSDWNAVAGPSEIINKPTFFPTKPLTNPPLFRWLPEGTLLGNYAMAVGNSPIKLAYDGINIWTTNQNNNTVSKISETGVTTDYAITAGGTTPQGIAFDGTNMWIAMSSNHSVNKIAPDGTTQTNYVISGLTGSSDICFDGKNMWIVDFINNTISKISLDGLTQVNYAILNGSGVFNLTFDGINIWAANTGNNSVTKIPIDGSAQSNYPITVGGTAPINISFDGVSIWIVDNDASTSIIKMSLNGLTQIRYTSVGGGDFNGIAFDGTNIWTISSGHHLIKQPINGSLFTNYTIPQIDDYSHLIFDGTNLWIANTISNTISKVLAITG